MSKGAIAGTVIGVLAAVAILGALIFVFARKGRRADEPVQPHIQVQNAQYAPPVALTGGIRRADSTTGASSMFDTGKRSSSAMDNMGASPPYSRY